MKEHINDIDTVNWLLYTIDSDFEFNGDSHVNITDYDIESPPVTMSSETEYNPIVLRYNPIMK